MRLLNAIKQNLGADLMDDKGENPNPYDFFNETQAAIIKKINIKSLELKPSGIVDVQLKAIITLLSKKIFF